MQPRDSGFSDYRKLSSPVKSPLGSLRHGIHAASETNRAIKLLRPDLASNEEFLTWYRAGVGMACQVKRETGAIPGLLTPIPYSNDPLSHRENTLAVEREWFPGENLYEFLNRRSKPEIGISEVVALSIFQKSVEIIRQLHAMGVPHLNLKPENVIIGRDHRSDDMTVRITDACTAIAKPLPGGAQAEARLNYCSASFLEDPGYLKTVSDIFSCGMLLYLLLENKDLAPNNMGRDSIVTWLREQLPRVIHDLRLTSAESSREIIIRCLTDKDAERYRDIEELRASVSQALGDANPTRILNDFVSRLEKKEDRPPDPPPRSLAEKVKRILRQVRKPLLASGGVVVVCLLVFWAYTAFQRHRLNISVDTEIQAIGEALDAIGGVTSACVREEEINAFKRMEASAKQLQKDGKLEAALISSRALRKEVDGRRVLSERCHRFATLAGRADSAKSKYADEEGFETLWVSFSRASESVREILNSSDSTVAEKVMLSMETAVIALEDFDGGILPCDPAALVDLEKQTYDLPVNCSDAVLELFDAARQACQNQNVELFDEIRVQMQQTIDGCEDGGALQDSARRVLSKAQNKLDNIKSTFDSQGLFYKGSRNYRDGVAQLKTARQRVASEQWSAAINNANLAYNNFRSIRPCIDLMGQYFGLKSSFGEDDPCFKRFDKFMQSCQCEKARAALTRPPCEAAKTTFDICYKELFLKGQYKQAEECFQALNEEDNLYTLGQKYVALIRARNAQFDKKFRKAFLAAGNKIQETNSVEDIDLYLGMACYFGWKSATARCDSALHYFEIAHSQGSMFNQASLRWRGLLVWVECLMKNPNRDWLVVEGALLELKEAYPRSEILDDPYTKKINAYFKAIRE